MKNIWLKQMEVQENINVQLKDINLDLKIYAKDIFYLNQKINYLKLR